MSKDYYELLVDKIDRIQQENSDNKVRDQKMQDDIKRLEDVVKELQGDIREMRECVTALEALKKGMALAWKIVYALGGAAISGVAYLLAR